jgi:hypothetical protein
MTEEDRPQTNGGSRTKVLGACLLAGLVAGLLMTLVMLLLRYTFGIATPSELIGDRIAPIMPVDLFLTLLHRVGGYNSTLANHAASGTP